MPKIDISKLPVRTGTIYPAAFKPVVAGREKTALGDAVGLTQFGVNLTRLKPGASSAMRHWHEVEDEFVFVVEGEITLVENDGDILLRTGECAAFKAGVANGHKLINKSDRDALYLEIGTRSKHDVFHYPDDGMSGVKDESGIRFTDTLGAPVA